jgi:hypothetical protein
MSDRWLAVAGIAPLAVYLGAGLLERHAAAATGDSTFSVRRVLDRYSIYNPTFRVADAIMRPSLSSSGQTAFMRFARANTAFAADLPPTSLDFVEPLAPAPHPPNLFLFVVDSLRPTTWRPTTRRSRSRRESMSSPRTPSCFATPSRALAAPAFRCRQSGWARSARTSQYIKPFWPMNTLEKLLTANRYRAVMGVDVIMEQLLRPADAPIELDRGVRTMDYRLCRTLDELESKMPVSSAADAPPIFAIRCRRICTCRTSCRRRCRQASRILVSTRRMPRASARSIAGFGEFVDFLKRHDLYDNSIVVLTSDHGEMLGEEGRWGHAYYHLSANPAGAAAGAPAAGRGPRDGAGYRRHQFLTDITPTVYAALGYHPRASNALMGEPLIGAGVASAVRRRGDYVAAAATAPCTRWFAATAGASTSSTPSRATSTRTIGARLANGDGLKSPRGFGALGSG